MKKRWMRALTALSLALMLVLTGVAVAEEEIVLSDPVEAEVTDEGEAELDLSPQETPEAPGEEAAGTDAGETVEETGGENVDDTVDDTADDASDDAEGEAEEAVFEAAAEEAVEAAAYTAVEMPLESPAQPMEAAAEAPVEAIAEAPVVIVDDAAADTAMKAANAGGPVSVSIDASQGRDFYLGMGPIQLNAVMNPADARTTLKWKSSKKKVVKVNANGLITPRKAGSAKITVTTGNKKKSTLKVNIHKNIVNNINPRPTRATLSARRRSWDFILKSVERTAGGKYVCKFYLINNLGSAKKITNLGLKLYVGGTLVGQKVVKRVRVSAPKGRARVFKVTFNPGEQPDPNPRLLPEYGAANIRYELTTNPSLYYAVRR